MSHGTLGGSSGFPQAGYDSVPTGHARPACPGIIASGRDRERAAHEPDRIATVVFLDRAVSHRESFAKHAAARLEKSRSFLRVSFSRLSRVSSSPSARPDWPVRPWDSLCRCLVLQRYSTVSDIPSSRATWATGRPIPVWAGPPRI